MAKLHDLIQKLDTALREDATYFSGLQAIYQVQFHDDDAVYQIIIDGKDGKVVDGVNKEADCTLTFVKEDFEKALQGQLNGTEAFMSGRLVIKGDKGLALKLQTYMSNYVAVT